MSGVWDWLGGGASRKSRDGPKRAILELRQQLELLQKRERHLQKLIEEQHDVARKNVNSNKAGKFKPPLPPSAARSLIC
jgi:charged multivesicular body protein 4